MNDEYPQIDWKRLVQALAAVAVVGTIFGVIWL